MKSISSSYAQNMLESMILMSYSKKSYFVASLDGYVASIRIMSRDKLYHQVGGQVLSRDKFILLYNIIFMSHRWLRYTVPARQIGCFNRRIFSLTTCQVS